MTCGDQGAPYCLGEAKVVSRHYGHKANNGSKGAPGRCLRDALTTRTKSINKYMPWAMHIFDIRAVEVSFRGRNYNSEHSYLEQCFQVALLIVSMASRVYYYDHPVSICN